MQYGSWNANNYWQIWPSGLFRPRYAPSMVIKKLILNSSYCSWLEWINIWAEWRSSWAEPSYGAEIIIIHCDLTAAACIYVKHSVRRALPVPSLVAWWAWRRWSNCAPTASSRNPRWSRPAGPAWPGKPSAVWGHKGTQRRERLNNTHKINLKLYGAFTTGVIKSAPQSNNQERI